jgi:hypothetical protein
MVGDFSRGRGRPLADLQRAACVRLARGKPASREFQFRQTVENAREPDMVRPQFFLSNLESANVRSVSFGEASGAAMNLAEFDEDCCRFDAGCAGRVPGCVQSAFVFRRLVGCLG